MSISEKERKNYINHIRRLQEENRTLKIMVLNERLSRQNAYAYYYKKMKSRWHNLMFVVMENWLEK